MAQKVQILLVDDIDQGEAAETISFSLDGVAYEIDLSAEHAGALRDAFAPWVGHARKVAGGRSGGGNRKAAAAPKQRAAGQSAPAAPAAAGPDTGAIRAWARENGYNPSDRGRISADIVKAYEAAHQD